MINAEYDKILIKTNQDEKTKDITVEAKCDVDSQSVAKVINVNAEVSVLKIETVADSVKFSGRAIFCLLYETVDGEIAKTERGVEFVDAITDKTAERNREYDLTITCKKCTADLYGGNLNVTAELNARLCQKTYAETNLLIGGENLVIKNKELACPTTYNAKANEYKLEEDFELNYSVKDVLLTKYSCSTLAVSAGAGVVIVDGEIYLSLLLLQKIENSDILKERKTLPFRLEVECSESMPSMNAKAKAEIKGVKLNIVVDEEKGTSSVSASLAVAITACVTDCQTKERAIDAYSPCFETELVYDNVEFEIPVSQKSYLEKFSCRGTFDSEISAGSRLMACVLDEMTVVGAETNGNKLTIDAVISAKCFFKDVEGKTSLKILDCPQTFTLETDDTIDKVDIRYAVSELTAGVTSLSQAELSGVVRFYVYYSKVCQEKIITALEIGKQKPVNTCAISVYSPEENEDLWTISKKLNTSPDEIMKLNKNLEFPLKGNEKVVIFRQIKREA